MELMPVFNSACTRPPSFDVETICAHLPRFIVGDIDGNLGLVARNRLYFNPLRTQRRFLPGSDMLQIKWTPETNPYIRRDLTEGGTMRLLGIDAKTPEERIADLIMSKAALREFVMACNDPRAAYEALRPLLLERFPGLPNVNDFFGGTPSATPSLGNGTQAVGPRPFECPNCMRGCILACQCACHGAPAND